LIGNGEENPMKTKTFGCWTAVVYLFSVGVAAAQELGSQFKKIKDGIYVYTAQLNDSNVTIIETQEGVVLIDTGQTPKDSRVVMAALKKLTSRPVRLSYIRSRIRIIRSEILSFHRRQLLSRTKARRIR